MKIAFSKLPHAPEMLARCCVATETQSKEMLAMACLGTELRSVELLEVFFPASETKAKRFWQGVLTRPSPKAKDFWQSSVLEVRLKAGIKAGGGFWVKKSFGILSKRECYFFLVGLYFNNGDKKIKKALIWEYFSLQEE